MLCPTSLWKNFKHGNTILSYAFEFPFEILCALSDFLRVHLVSNVAFMVLTVFTWMARAEFKCCTVVSSSPVTPAEFGRFVAWTSPTPNLVAKVLSCRGGWVPRANHIASFSCCQLIDPSLTDSLFQRVPSGPVYLWHNVQEKRRDEKSTDLDIASCMHHRSLQPWSSCARLLQNWHHCDPWKEINKSESNLARIQSYSNGSKSSLHEKLKQSWLSTDWTGDSGPLRMGGRWGLGAHPPSAMNSFLCSLMYFGANKNGFIDTDKNPGHLFTWSKTTTVQLITKRALHWQSEVG